MSNIVPQFTGAFTGLWNDASQAGGDMANSVAGSLGARRKRVAQKSKRKLSKKADEFRQDRKNFLKSSAKFMKFRKKNGTIAYYKKKSGTFKNGVKWRAVSGKLTPAERRSAAKSAVSFESMRKKRKGSPKKKGAKKAAPKKKGAKKGAPKRKAVKRKYGGARKTSYVVKNGKRTKKKRPSAADACAMGKPIGTIVTYDRKKMRLARMRSKSGKMTCKWVAATRSSRKSHTSPKRTPSGAKYGGLANWWR